jgi:hypothetical protein
MTHLFEDWKEGNISDKSSTGNVSMINEKCSKNILLASFYCVPPKRKWSKVKEKNFLIILQLEKGRDP